MFHWLCKFSILFCSTICALNPEELILQQFIELSQDPEGSLFEPPENWGLVDAATLPKSIQLMAVGNNCKGGRPPSIYLATEKYSGTIKKYLKLAREIAQSHGGTWRDLGTLKTKSGTAQLTQVESKLKWGTNRMLHAFLLHEGTMHIVTASAPKEEFGNYYNLFIPALKSLSINKLSTRLDTTSEKTNIAERSQQKDLIKTPAE